MHSTIKSLIIGTGLACSITLCGITVANATSQSQVPESMFKSLATACGDVSTNGRAISCLGSQLMLYTSAFQIMRYGMSAATGGETHQEMSLIGTLYDAHCALDLMKSYNKKLGTIENVYNRSKTNGNIDSAKFINEGWNEYTDRANGIDPETLKPNGPQTKDWKEYYAPKFTSYFINKTPLAVLRGAGSGYVKEKLDHTKGSKVNPDAVVGGFVDSLCQKKVQAGMMKVVTGKKSSGLAWITDSVFWDKTVDTESKANNSLLFADAAYKASHEGVSALDDIVDDMTSDIRDEMAQYGHAEKIKANKIIGMLKSLVGAGNKNKQPSRLGGLDMNAPLSENLSAQSPVVKQFGGKLERIIEQGKFFDPNSAVGKYVTQLQVFKNFMSQSDTMVVKNENSSALAGSVNKTIDKAQEAVETFEDKSQEIHEKTANNTDEVIISTPGKVVEKSTEELSFWDKIRNMKPSMDDSNKNIKESDETKDD
ncbi:hypothetical protein [Colwellia sp. 20A7]|uniref:hypothetical protein n=1 Tax=Colwellia sp. 20A7 TaxID=2689569 RepID=UPI00135A118A|nr:hypothetical protein [Colwellia sp. 20A7]